MDLKQALAPPEFSIAFCKQAKAMGYSNLQDILSEAPNTLLRKKEFTYAWLGELTSYLQQRDLLHLLQPTPGKTND